MILGDCFLQCRCTLKIPLLTYAWYSVESIIFGVGIKGIGGKEKAVFNKCLY